MNFPRQTLAFIDQKTRDHARTGIGGQGSGEIQVRGLIDRRKIRGGPPHGYRLLESPLSLDRDRYLEEGTLDIVHRPEQLSVLLEMPNKNPEKAKQLKHEWYLKNKERLLQQKRERRAANKKLKPPHQSRLLQPERRTGWLSTVTEQAFGPNTPPQPGLLSPEPRTDRAAAAGLSCPGSAEQTTPVPKVACVGGRVCRTITGIGAWIRQD